MTPRPPERVLRFLRWFCDDRFLEEIEGDLCELYAEWVETEGVAAANRKFRRAALAYIRPYFFRRRSAYSVNHLTMNKHHFKIAARFFWRNKAFTLINVLGLTLGIACALLIAVIVRHDAGFDRFHTQADRIYRITRVGQGSGPEDLQTGVSFPLAEAIRDRLPAATQATAMDVVYNAQMAVLQEQGGMERKFIEKAGGVFADAYFFQVFDFGHPGDVWLAGDPATALAKPLSVVLTQSLAEKYFGTADPIGRLIRFDNRLDFTVTGVVRDFPANTDLPFTYLFSYATLNDYYNFPVNTDWMNLSEGHNCYVVLGEGVTVDLFHQQLDQLHASLAPADVAESRTYRLQPLRDVHTDPRFGNYNNRTVSRATLFILGAVGLFLLIIASINYVNLATAQSILRTKEIGLRKVVGGNSGQIRGQVFAESLSLTLISAALAAGLVELAVPVVRNQLDITLNGHWDGYFLLGLFVLVILVAFGSGFYPAKVLSGFSPVQAFRSAKGIPNRGGLSLRQVLIVFQFGIAQVFIICTLFILFQVRHFRHADWGFDQEAVVTVRIPANEPGVLQRLREQWGALSQVKEVSFASSLPSAADRGRNFTLIRLREAAEGEDIVSENFAIDTSFLRMYAIPLVAGRGFSSNPAEEVLLNETLAKDLGFSDPGQAIGKPVNFSGQAGVVTGVIRDFRAGSFREERGRVVLSYRSDRFHTASIKLQGNALAGGAFSETLKSIEARWEAAFPAYVFEYSFLDDQLAAHYAAETRLARLFQLLAGIAVLIGCLGLYGLVVFLVHQKTKEIGIRKVLGAGLGNILALLTREYAGLLLVAFVLAVPVAYWFLRRWLENFTERIPLSPWLFVAGLGITLLIALFTVGARSVKAALADPIKSLRAE